MMDWRKHTRLLLVGIVCFVSTCTTTPVAETTAPEVDGPHIIPLSVHYLTDNDDARWRFSMSMQHSNETLMPHGIGLVVWTEDRVFRMPSDVRSIQDRQVLGSRVERDGTLHVFVADNVSLKTGDNLNGMHTPGFKNSFVVLSIAARSTTLAHEVGHFLGLEHEKDEDNVMCSNRHSSDVHFTKEQGAQMRSTLLRGISEK